MINIAGIIHNDLANGPGVRCTVFVQGCKHGCEMIKNDIRHISVLQERIRKLNQIK